MIMENINQYSKYFTKDRLERCNDILSDEHRLIIESLLKDKSIPEIDKDVFKFRLASNIWSNSDVRPIVVILYHLFKCITLAEGNKPFIDYKLLFLKPGIHKCLNRYKLYTWRDLVTLSRVDLLKIPGIGNIRLNIIESTLAKMNLRLGMSEYDVNLPNTKTF